STRGSTRASARRRVGPLMPPEPLLEVKDLHVSFRTEDGIVRAVDGVSFTVGEGEVVGIVGESGSGKSVTMLSVMRLIADPNVMYTGEIIYKGRNLMALSRDAMREVRGEEISMIFQDPMTSLNPVYDIGWQIEAQILELIKDLKRDFGSAVALITHDLGVVADIADRILVMYAGRIVEEGNKEQIFYDPQHPYTWGLLGSIARLDRPRPRRLTAIAGQPPSMINRPRGCAFRPRCPQAFE